MVRRLYQSSIHNHVAKIEFHRTSRKARRNLPAPCSGCSPCPAQIRRTDDGLIPTALAIAGAVQWVAACGGAWLVSATTRSTVAAGKGAKSPPVSRRHCYGVGPAAALARFARLA
jgi:hypothetical protein